MAREIRERARNKNWNLFLFRAFSRISRAKILNDLLRVNFYEFCRIYSTDSKFFKVK